MVMHIIIHTVCHTCIRPEQDTGIGEEEKERKSAVWIILKVHSQWAALNKTSGVCKEILEWSRSLLLYGMEHEKTTGEGPEERKGKGGEGRSLFWVGRRETNKGPTCAEGEKTRREHERGREAWGEREEGGILSLSSFPQQLLHEDKKKGSTL